MKTTSASIIGPEVRSPSAPSAVLGGWTLHVVASADSTNRLARTLAPWHAIRAEVQTGGYGRTGRTWISDAGGLWLSAVLPCPAPRERWAVLPLAVGQALISALSELGATGLRLRWPNDILSGKRKLAGLLVERHDAHNAIVGIGLNIHNHPEAASPELRDAILRLADLTNLEARSIDKIATVVLSALALAHSRLLAGDFPAIAEELNRTWTEPRRVELTLAGRPSPATGQFMGIDSAGNLRVRTDDGATHCYDATQVALLRELD